MGSACCSGKTVVTSGVSGQNLNAAAPRESQMLRRSSKGSNNSSQRAPSQMSEAQLAIRRKSQSKDCEGRSVGALGCSFPARPLGCRLSAGAWEKIERLFHRMDPDGSNAVTREEAKSFFKCAFGQISVDAMFNEVDVDRSGAIDAKEFVKFWIQVRKNGYSEQDILDELDELLEGGAWVDWQDGRDTDRGNKVGKFPKRPMLCRLSKQCWQQCEDLFRKIDADKSMAITHDKATAHFKASFGSVSADAMFNEIDVNHHGHITPKEWMKFWVQVRASGYKDHDIVEELEQLMEGSTWVDWKDGRSVA